MGNAKSALGLGLDNGIGTDIANRAEGDERHIGAALEAAAFANGDFLQRTFPIAETPFSTGIADDEGTLSRKLCREHQATQFALIIRRGDGEVGHGTQGGQIKGTMMRRPVFADQSGTVQT